MKKINEKLMDIDLFVDIKLKTDFIGFHITKTNILEKVTVLIKSHSQWVVHNHTCDLQSGLLNTQT